MASGEAVRVLGIDPGTLVTGYGVLQQQGKQVVVVQAGVLHLPKDDDALERMEPLWHRMLALMQEVRPTVLAVETPFAGKNPQSLLKLGRAQGVILAAAYHVGVPVAAYPPTEVKRAVTGRGSASKQQVARMLAALYPGQHEADLPLDATDALAVALCHLRRSYATVPAAVALKPKKKGAGWGHFVASNPGRVQR